MVHYKSNDLKNKEHAVWHREDGPAIEWPDGHKEWWIDDRKLTEQEFNEWREQKALKEAFKAWNQP